MATIALRGLHNSSPRHSLQLFTHCFPTRCHASTATARSPSTIKAPLPTKQYLPSTVNAPATTLPAVLDLPVREKNQPFFFKYAFRLGKAYASFYKTGVQNIFVNFRSSRTIQTELDKTYNGSLQAAIKAGYLTRQDFQLLVRNWHDVKRVPIFALVFLVCGELTPLVVIALSSVVPWTCRIPKQIQSDRQKLEKRRAISFRSLTTPPPQNGGVEKLERQQLLHISWSLGLSSSLWDWLGGQYPGLPTFFLRRKVQQRVEYLEMDDRLIGKIDRVKDLTLEELKIALVDRGVDVMEKDENDLRTDLTCWLRSREKESVERLLLTRPSVWPVRRSRQT